MIYLDHNATTPPLPEVVEVVARHLAESYANPGSRHQPGRRARRVLEGSRESMAAILGADPRELVFTSGGTEANNMAVLGFTAGPPGGIALTAGEHPAVMEAARFRQPSGWSVQTLPVDGDGRLKTGEPLAADVRLAWNVTPALSLALVGRNLHEARHLEFIGAAPAGNSEIRRSVSAGATWRW